MAVATILNTHMIRLQGIKRDSKGSSFNRATNRMLDPSDGTFVIALFSSFGCDRSNHFIGPQRRHYVRRWPSPPDPSTNHNFALSAQRKGTAAWFMKDTIFEKWKTTGSEPLLWIHGTRTYL